MTEGHWLLKHTYKNKELHGYISFKGSLEQAKRHAKMCIEQDYRGDIFDIDKTPYTIFTSDKSVTIQIIPYTAKDSE